ncbi:MAG TPA: hypothetical protein VFP52_01480, partial [Myxococcales bacterium]|nr:hypothetical protein [Myxococcales bacterium]
MSEKPEHQEPQSQARKRQPSFEEILSGASVEEPKAAPPPPPPKKQAQPTFEEILARAQPSSAPAAESKPPERRSRPPRQKEERKMPVVVRKVPLGGQPAASEPAAAQAKAEAPEHRPAPEDPGSVFSQPSAEENADFGALLAESQQQRPGKLRVGQKVSAKVAHLGGEVAFLDLGGKGEGILDLRELRDDKGELLVQAGATIDGYVLSLGEGNVVVTRS